MGCISKNGETIREQVKDMGFENDKCEVCKKRKARFKLPVADNEDRITDGYLNVCLNCKLDLEQEQAEMQD